MASKTLSERFQNKYRTAHNGCWLWQHARNVKGYGWLRYGGRMQLAHRMAWVLFRGPIPDGLCVLHHCDTPACVNPDHLFLGSTTDNNADRHAKGRSRGATGEANGKARLRVGEVLQIREKFVAGAADCSALAKQFGCSYWAVWDVVQGRTWKDLGRKDAGRAE